MVDARISEVLLGIQKISLIHLPEEAVPPHVLIELNIEHREQAGNINLNIKHF